MSYTEASRRRTGRIVVNQATKHSAGVWRAMAWFSVGEAAMTRGYAVTSSNGEIVRGYVNP